MRPESVQAGRQAGRQAVHAQQRGLVMQEKSLCSGVLSYIMCLLLQVMMQVIIMHGMRHQHLRSGPRGTAGIDNGDARPPACTYTNTHRSWIHARKKYSQTHKDPVFFSPKTHTHTHTHTPMNGCSVHARSHAYTSTKNAMEKTGSHFLISQWAGLSAQIKGPSAPELQRLTD